MTSAGQRYYERHRGREIARSARWAKDNAQKVNATSVERRSQRTPVEVVLWRNAKNRAAAKGVAFSISVDDIRVPEKCPVLGLQLVVGTGHARPNSPSLDRIDPAKGYEPGNVSVISHRANTIKSNASADELRAVLDYLETMT